MEDKIKKTIKICKHKGKLMMKGFWDGIEMDTGKPVCGPIVKCDICGKKFDLSWEEWKALPKKRKKELETYPMKIEKLKELLRKWEERKRVKRESG